MMIVMMIVIRIIVIKTTIKFILIHTLKQTLKRTRKLKSETYTYKAFLEPLCINTHQDLVMMGLSRRVLWWEKILKRMLQECRQDSSTA